MLHKHSLCAGAPAWWSHVSLNNSANSSASSNASLPAGSSFLCHGACKGTLSSDVPPITARAFVAALMQLHSMATSTARHAVLSSYRELCRLIRRLPTQSERNSALKQAHQEMRAHDSAGDEEAADLHRVLVSKISVLRMKVPRSARDAGKVGVGRFVVRDGRVVEGEGQHSSDRCMPTLPVLQQCATALLQGSTPQHSVRACCHAHKALERHSSLHALRGLLHGLHSVHSGLGTNIVSSRGMYDCGTQSCHMRGASECYSQ